ncbi:MAG: hypothetical protein ACOCWM_04420 [Cyclobacteriaceae bacterium]
MESKKYYSGASHIKSLIDMAQCDGLVDEKEIILLNNMAEKFDLSQEDLKNIKKYHRKVNFVPPADLPEKIGLFYDIVQMMIIDGKIEEKEMQLCNKYAAMLEINPENINNLVKLIHAGITKGQSKETTLSAILTGSIAS